MYVLIKDPHVRIVGKVEQVQRAKERILSSLDSGAPSGELTQFQKLYFT